MTYIGKYKFYIEYKTTVISYGNCEVKRGLARQKSLLFLARNASSLAACSSASPCCIARGSSVPIPFRQRNIQLRHNADKQNHSTEATGAPTRYQHQKILKIKYVNFPLLKNGLWKVGITPPHPTTPTISSEIYREIRKEILDSLDVVGFFSLCFLLIPRTVYVKDICILCLS